MNRAVPSQDSSPESFARLLNRLTRSPGSHAATLDPLADSLADPLLDPLDEQAHDARHDPLADEYSVRVSISGDAAALSGRGKRTLAPVRARAQAGRNGAEASEISYEYALRQHSRLRPPAPADLGTHPPREENETPANRAHAEAKAISALRQAKASLSETKISGKAVAAGSSGSSSPAARLPSAPADRPAGSRRTAPTRKTANSQSEKSKRESAKRTAAGVVTAAARKATKAERTEAALSSAAAGAPKSAKPARNAAAKPETIRGRENGPAEEGSGEGFARALSGDRSSSLDLEVAPRRLALTQRQSIVSIRLSAIESEQLRQRALESGISVSAYMRSCLLEAEHLRAQVKQALAELRAPQALAGLPQLEPPSAPLFPLEYEPVETSAATHRAGLVGFLSGVFALFLGRFHR